MINVMNTKRHNKTIPIRTETVSGSLINPKIYWMAKSKNAIQIGTRAIFKIVFVVIAPLIFLKIIINKLNL